MRAEPERRLALGLCLARGGGGGRAVASSAASATRHHDGDEESTEYRNPRRDGRIIDGARATPARDTGPAAPTWQTTAGMRIMPTRRAEAPQEDRPAPARAGPRGLVALSACGSRGPAGPCGGQAALHSEVRRVPHPEQRRHQGHPGTESRPRFRRGHPRRAGAQHDRGGRQGPDQGPPGRRDARQARGGQGRDRVSAYVADAIGKKAGASAGGGPSGTAKANAQNVVEIPTDPTGQLAYKFKSASAKAGKVTVQSKNDASVPHDIALKGGPAGKVVSGGAVRRSPPT